MQSPPFRESATGCQAPHCSHTWGEATLSTPVPTILVTGFEPFDGAAEGPDARLSTLPLRSILAGRERRGVSGGLSNSAGTFVCNQVLYTLLGECARHGLPGGFVHVPAPRTPEGDLPQPNSGGLPLEAMVEGVVVALEATLTR
jgi:pyroglutamyl-peptidase